MTSEGQGTILHNTISIMRDLLGSQSHGVSADNIQSTIMAVGSALITVRNDEEGKSNKIAVLKASTAAPVNHPVVENIPAAPVESPVTDAQTTSMSPVAPQAEQPKARRGRPPKNATSSPVQASAPAAQPVVPQPVVIKAAPVLAAASAEPEAPRKRGRPKGTGKRQLEAAAQAAAMVASHTNAETGEVIVYDDPDPRSPRYKFKHLRDRFGVLSNGQAKRFNDLKVNDEIDETVDGDEIICLFDGEKRQMLKRYLNLKYGMTPQEYITYFDLPADYKVVNPLFSASKSKEAKANGLGQKRNNIVAAPQEEVAQQATPATVTRRTRSRASA